MNKIISVLLFIALSISFSSCSQVNSSDSNSSDINIDTNFSWKDYFGVETNLKSYNEYIDNTREWGDFIISDFEGGISINKYIGDDVDVHIPETIDSKPVVKLGSDWILKEDGHRGYFGAFGENVHCNLYIPSTVKYIEDAVLKVYYGLVEDTFYTQYNNFFDSIYVDENNPYYYSENNCIFTKDKKTLIYVNFDVYDIVTYPDREYVIPDSVEVFHPYNFIENYKYYLVFDKNIKEISAHVELGENGFTPDDFVKADVKVKGYKGTVAEEWAEHENLTFIPLD